MTAATDFALSAKPKLITRITSGSGIYVPTADMARCLVRQQAGGAGGNPVSGYAGGAGAMVELLLRIPIAGLAYVVGAGGAIGANGSDTTFGQYYALHGTFGNGNGPGIGGPVGILMGAVDTDGASIYTSGLSGMSGGGGGASGSSLEGLKCGFPVNQGFWSTYSGSSSNPGVNHFAGAPNGQGSGSGGDSFYGKGGAAGSSPAAGNYGAGGGSNAAGAGGLIEIWDYGA